jgi:hypothetical protein
VSAFVGLPQNESASDSGCPGIRSGGSSVAFELHYDELINLDAEDLAEAGIKQAYEELGPALCKYVHSAAELRDEIDNDVPRYSVMCLGMEYFVYGGDEENESWGRATFALFDIVNRQLTGTPYRFFAINGGNDLGGMFLTLEQAEEAKRSLPRKLDWPYLPVLRAPWYGQYH